MKKDEKKIELIESVIDKLEDLSMEELTGGLSTASSAGLCCIINEHCNKNVDPIEQPTEPTN